MSRRWRPPIRQRQWLHKQDLTGARPTSPELRQGGPQMPRWLIILIVVVIILLILGLIR